MENETSELATDAEELVFSSTTFQEICDELASKDKDLQLVIETYGYPPMWTRPNSFETFVHIILEQQVSLASALAALTKLRVHTKHVTPENVLLLTDEEMKACYFSKQKMGYARGLASAIVKKDLDLDELVKLPNDTIRKELKKLKGIGNWTVDVYLMFVLQRADIFPIGDLAAVNALKKLKKFSTEISAEKIHEVTATWKPYRTVAAMILWHYYLSSKAK